MPSGFCVCSTASRESPSLAVGSCSVLDEGRFLGVVLGVFAGLFVGELESMSVVSVRRFAGFS